MDIGINGSQGVSAARITALPVAQGAGPIPVKAASDESSARVVNPATRAEESGESVEQAVSSIQSFVQSIRRDLNFSLDESSGRVVVKVTDGISGDVIRQLPSEEALRLAESLEEIRSLLFTAQA